MAPIFVVPFLSSLKNYIQELRFLFKIILGKKKSLLKNIFLTMPLVKQNKQTKKKRTYLIHT